MPVVVRRVLRWSFIMLVGLLLAVGPAAAALGGGEGRRVALVVGNGAYDAVPSLKNAVRDAEEIARTLRGLGFEVIERSDVSREGFSAALDEFYRASADADSAVFFYSGHGFQLRGTNYLVPVDATLRDRSRIETETVRLDDIAAKAQNRRRQTLIFLDACRNNPLPPAIRAAEDGEGLAQLETGSGTFIAFATQPGNITRDGGGDHSPFTSALLKHMPTPGISVSDMMIDVRNSVEVATANTQTPWDQSSLRSQFYFMPAVRTAALPAGGEVVSTPSQDGPAAPAAEQPGLSEEEAAAERVAEIQPGLLIQPGVIIGSGEETGAEDRAGAEPAPNEPPASALDDEPVRPGLAISGGPSIADEPAQAAAAGMTAAATGGAARPQTTIAALRDTPERAAEAATPARPILEPANRPRDADPVKAGSVAEAGVRVAETSGGVSVSRPWLAASVVRPSEISTQAVGRRADAIVTVPDERMQAYDVALRTSEPRSVSIPAVPSASLSPVAGQERRIVGQEEVIASDLPAAPAGKGEAGIRIASVDPAEIGALPAAVDAAQPPAAAEEPAAEDVDVPMAIQTELARLGCYRNTIDGEWGAGSERALKRYYEAKKTAPGSLEPNADVLASLSGEDKDVCTRAEPPVKVKQPPQVKSPAVVSTQPRGAKDKKATTTRATREETKRPSGRQNDARQPKGPKPPKLPNRTIAAPAAPKATKREASSTSGKSLKRTMTMGAFR